jgi:hypothetical protein
LRVLAECQRPTSQCTYGKTFRGVARPFELKAQISRLDPRIRVLHSMLKRLDNAASHVLALGVCLYRLTEMTWSYTRWHQPSSASSSTFCA